MIKICEYCKKEFKTPKSKRKFCGRECYKKYIDKNKDTFTSELKPIKECVYCGKKFPANINALYCSKKCGYGAEYGKRRIIVSSEEKEIKIKVCEYCGKTFEYLSHERKYCSLKCGVKHNTIKKREKHIPAIKTLYQRSCQYCGKYFETYISTQIFCCKACNVATNRLRAKQVLITPFPVDFTYTKNCGFCGEVFETRKSYKRFCKDECRSKYFVSKKSKKRREEIEKIRRICKNCGKEFTIQHIRQIYCKNLCLVQYHSREGAKEFVKIMRQHREKVNKGEI